MSRFASRPVLLNLLTIAVTVVLVAIVLVVGRVGIQPPVELVIGQPSPQDYIAPRSIEVPDEIKTEEQRVFEENNVPAIYARDTSLENRNSVQALFDQIRKVAPTVVIPSEVPTTTVPPPDQTEPPVDGETTTIPPEDPGPTTSSTSSTTSTSTTTTTAVPPPTIEEQIDTVVESFRTFEDAIRILVPLHNADLEKAALGEGQSYLLQVQNLVETALDSYFREEIKSPSALQSLRNTILEDPPSIFITGLTEEENAATSSAAARIIERSLVVNSFVDEEATQAARDAARAKVEPVLERFFEDAPIVNQGEPITQVQLAAIEKLGLNIPEVGANRLAVSSLGALAVMLAAFFLWRLAPTQWSKPKHFALLGTLLVLAAVASRVPGILTTDDPTTGFLIPAMMFGYIAAILYDPRTAVLMAVPMATFTAVSTGDVALTLYAAAATVVPVAFVSAVSSRRELRLAIAQATVVLSPLGFATAWLFYGDDRRWKGALFAFLGGVIAGLIAQGLVSFFETIFRVTTTLTLLDLTDRNHPALRLIEERAPGTFNHSILVGTLAGKAAREIGANPLLAQAAAYYHDLGKTENPRFFIENQFGVSNPHDRLDPVSSAAIIRRHVTDGLRLAREFRLPTEIVDGIRMHHGCGLMRYFYHQALEADPNVDASLFRHEGVKPKRKELAILMLCDAVEGATRAAAMHEDPTEESLTKLVDAIVNEKLDDGQLDEADLTFGDLTTVKRAIVDALVGYYHTRVSYPGFPTMSEDSS